MPRVRVRNFVIKFGILLLFQVSVIKFGILLLFQVSVIKFGILSLFQVSVIIEETDDVENHEESTEVEDIEEDGVQKDISSSDEYDTDIEIEGDRKLFHFTEQVQGRYLLSN